MKQTPNNNKATMNNKATAKQTKKQRKAEADAHRRTNKRWERVETSDRYRKAATEELCNVTTNKIEIEVLDGILLNLNIRSKMKPSKVQDRILRRIVEKRQAQEAWAFRRSHLNAHHPCMHKQVHEGYQKEKIRCMNFQK
jgi:hypothetical protein